MNPSIILLALYRAAFRDFAFHIAQVRQRGVLSRQPQLAVVCGGLWHDWRLAFGGHVHVGARRRIYGTVYIYAFGFWLCDWLCGDCVGLAAFVLPPQPHLDIHLFKYALRAEVGEDRCGVFHPVTSAWFGVEDVSRCVCAL